VLQEKDFFHVQALIQHYISVKQFSKRQQMQQERLKTIKNAWKTKDYALKIIADLE